MRKRVMGALTALCVAAGAIWANGGQQAPKAAETAGEPDIEVWVVNVGLKPVEKGSPVYNLYKELLDVGVTMPYVEWNGGVDYLNKLNMQIAAGTMPNMFLPYNGIEADLAKNGAIADLTDLLPKYAPKLWNLIPQSAWDVVRANDPTGKGRIYWIPGLSLFEKEGGQIRQDWLDKLGLAMPRTQEEYVNVLRAFRDRDPNGNGQKDELPTGGRQGARWMDHLFNMYGIAMFEGYPDWDIYDGQLTYAAVTQNAKDALVFIRQLYEEKLIDPETFLNDKSGWEGKIHSNRVGNFFHWTSTSYEFLNNINRTSGVKAALSILPVIQAPGYEGRGFVTTKPTQNPVWVLSARQDEARLMVCLKLLNALADESKWDALYYGVEGMHYNMVNGKKIRIPDDSTMQLLLFAPFNNWASLDFVVDLLEDARSPDTAWMYDQSIREVQDLQQYIHVIAGDGLPSSVYADYPDIQRATLWQEYATKIIIGTFGIDKFDEFVDRWNRSGGAEVTARARAWYAKTQQK